MRETSESQKRQQSGSILSKVENSDSNFFATFFFYIYTDTLLYFCTELVCG